MPPDPEVHSTDDRRRPIDLDASVLYREVLGHERHQGFEAEEAAGLTAAERDGAEEPASRGQPRKRMVPCLVHPHS